MIYFYLYSFWFYQYSTHIRSSLKYTIQTPQISTVQDTIEMSDPSVHFSLSHMFAMCGGTIMVPIL